MKLFKSAAKKQPFIDKNGKLFGKYDIFVPLFFLIIIVLGVFIGRVVFQKDTYITAEIFASGGEWWWNNPSPPYWLSDLIKPGSKEFDPQGNVLVEVIDTRKFEAGDRKMLWMKVKLRVTPMKGSKQYRFRLDPIQVGSLIYVAPNNVRIASNVMWIEGIDQDRTEAKNIITIEEYNVFPWLADAIKVGDVMKADDGTILAEVLDKQVRIAKSDIVSIDGLANTRFSGRMFVEPNESRRDITIKLRVTTTGNKERRYFSYFQPLKIGFYIWIPLERENISGNIISVE